MTKRRVYESPTVTIELAATDPPEGIVRLDEIEEAFVGWVGLLHALNRLGMGSESGGS